MILLINYLNLLILVRTHKPTKKVSHLHQDINRPFLSKVLLCLLRKIARKYSDEISLENKMPFDKGCSYHFYWICVKNRSEFRKKLAENGLYE